jgi:hypothetical protein
MGVKTVAKELTGYRFGMLEVLERVENDKRGSTMWLCVCDCGRQTIKRGQELTRGHTKSCGCYRFLLLNLFYNSQTIDIKGLKIGRLEVIDYDSPNNLNYYKCQCSCGNTCIVLKRNLLKGKTKSCGCLNKENSIKKCLKINQKRKEKIGIIA